MANFTESDLKQKQSLTLEQKIEYSKKLVSVAMDHFDDDMYISNSGGKDSAVLSHLIHKHIGNDVPDVYCNTGLEWKAIQQRMLRNPNVTVIKPDMVFKEVIQRYGYPIFSKEQSAFISEYWNTKSDKLRNIRICGNDSNMGKISQKYYFMLFPDSPKCSDKCCDIMKKKPFHKFESETGLHPFIGTLADESMQRKSNWKMYGCNEFSKAGRPASRPLSIWTNDDILEYILRYDVEYPYEVYGEIKEYTPTEQFERFAQGKTDRFYTTKCDRTGCVFCGFGCQNEDDRRFLLLKEMEPKKYEYVFKSISEGGLGYEDLFRWIESRSAGKIVIKR